MYSWLAKALSSATAPPSCSHDPQRCRQLWQLAHHFAPTQSLTAQLFRAKVLVPLGGFDTACDAYERLMLEPQAATSPPLLSNLSVCRFLRGAATIDEALALLERAAHVPVGTQRHYAHGAIESNLKIFRAWATAFRAEHGDREPTATERLTYNDWYMV